MELHLCMQDGALNTCLCSSGCDAIYFVDIEIDH